ncbi:MAG: PD-(D/E)XK nuclease family protein [Gammaproteobacteria bacterium]|nr:PD-(D/E)XK nuclease family protein [Gammaproteobacteria bacterium]
MTEGSERKASLTPFFDGLAEQLEGLGLLTEGELGGFFAELAPRLETASALERDLDRHLARRFNVLDYLRSDELALSRIIADLLDPAATHGQGPIFLTAFLDMLKDGPEWKTALPIPELSNNYETKINVVVETERGTSTGRRIDISVELRDEKEAYCLAFENKPYAEDQGRQVADYLEFLHKAYGRRFTLIYLSPTGEPPSEDSVSGKEVVEKWQDRFVILAYCQLGNEWDDAFVRLSDPLTAWLTECRRLCDVDRLRWFLRDFENFCGRVFGGQTMIGQSERDAVMKFVTSDATRLHTAQVVSESWPGIRDQICERFLERLCERIKENERLKAKGSDLEVEFKYEGGKRKGNRLWLHRKQWSSRDAGNPDSGGRFAVRMETWGPGPDGWYVGVLAPISENNLSEDGRRQRQALVKQLKEKLPNGNTDKDWPWWVSFEDETRGWSPIVVQLHKECENENGGPLMARIADRFIDIAAEMIPVMDEWEGQGPTP